MKRIHSVDIVRGLAMIIMALDHVRDLMHIHSITQGPTDLATTSPVLFFTRWITYLCAPIFVFLAGTSAFLSFKNKKDLEAAKKHLLTRGMWLIFMEFTIVNFALFFDPGFHTLLFEVIASSGFGFIALSFLLKLSPRLLGIIGLIIIFCHNLLTPFPFADNSILKNVLLPFFNPASLPIVAGKIFVVGYPPIPWLGIMLVGFASGQFFELGDEKRKNVFIKIGMGALLAFIAIRFANVYGDSFPWTSQKNALFTFLSFINITKYPPSLLFCLVTLGIMFLLLAFGESLNTNLKKVLTVYGKVPLFYFVIHFYLVHILTIVMLLLQGFHWSQLAFSSGSFGRPKDLESGLPLWAIYLIWIGVVITLYKPCQWFAGFKASHKNWWLRYI